MNTTNSNMPVRQIVELIIAVLTAVLPFLLKKNVEKNSKSEVE